MCNMAYKTHLKKVRSIFNSIHPSFEPCHDSNTKLAVFVMYSEQIRAGQMMEKLTFK